MLPNSQNVWYPALALDLSRRPHIFFGKWIFMESAGCWGLWGFIYRKIGSTWEKDSIMVFESSEPGIKPGPYSLFFDGDTAYFTLELHGENFTPQLWCFKYHPDLYPNKFVLLGYWYDNNFRFLKPSLLIDSEKRMIVAYVRKEIVNSIELVYIRYKDHDDPNWSDPILVSNQGGYNEVTYSFSTKNTSLYFALAYRAIFVFRGDRSGSGGYSWTQDFYHGGISQSISPAPMIIEGDYLVWHEQINQSLYHIFFTRRDGNHWTTPQIISNSPYSYNSTWPQICKSSSLLYAVWTKGPHNTVPWFYWINNTKVRLPVWSVPYDKATKSNNAHLLTVEPDNGNIHMVYNTCSTTAYSKSTNEGNTWFDIVEIDSGSYPSVALDSSGLPRINYLKNDTVFCQILKADSTWDTLVIFGYNESWKPKEPAVAPSYPPELADYSYCAFSTNDPTSINSNVNLSIFNVTEDTAPLPNEVASGENLNWPSIAITPGDYVHIVWEQKGDIYYRTSLQPIDPEEEIVWSDIFNVSASPMVYSEHPVVEAYGENIIVAWKEGNPGEIYRRIRNINSDIADWLEIENISRSSTQESDYPVLSTQDVVAWQEQIDSLNYEIYAWIQGDIVNLSETENSSKYPHIAVEPQDFTGDTITPAIVINTIWTETVIPDSLYEVIFRRYEHDQGGDGISGTIEYISVSVGDSLASPYCKKRDGFIQYGEYSLDYSRSSLVYNLPYLKPQSSYLIRALVYQGERDRWREKMYIDDSLTADVYIDPKIPRMVNIVLPKASFGTDLEINKEIRRILGRIAIVADLKVYEVTLPDTMGDKEGALANKVDLIRYALYQNRPNPFKDITKISFALPRECNVSLFIYDITGRRVRTLINGKMQPGNYNYTWDGKDNRNRRLTQGVYFYRLQTDDFKDTKKTVLLK